MNSVVIFMPAGGIHLCIAKKLAKCNKKLDNFNFYIGNIAPDSWRNSGSTKNRSHFNNKTSRNDYMKFYDKYKNHLDDMFVYGYLTHLITDNYWYGHKLYPNDYIVPPIDYYREINKITSILMKRYDIDKLDHIDDNFVNIVEEIETSGINKTIDYLNKENYKTDCGKMKYDVDKIDQEIDVVYNFVKKELERLDNKW